ncbi:MAG TPA: hypothetical protein VF535_06015 [Allosphingosinicella sp.]|jgi:hypothetical protein
MMSLVIAVAAAASAPPPDLVQCRMMECNWSRPVSNVAVRSTPAGTLRKVTAFRGTSVFQDDAPSSFDESIPIAWERKSAVQYVLCSRSQPALAFRSGRRWVAHALDLFDLGGYQTASAIGYLRACHGVDYRRDDIEKVMKDLGYRPGTRSEQVEIARPDQLFDLPRRSR